MCRPLCFLTLQIVVVGILGHAAVQKGPCQVVHSILFVLHRLGDDLSIEMVMKAVVQVRFHGQRLVEELLEEVLKNKEAQYYEELNKQLNDNKICGSKQALPFWTLDT